MRTVLLILLLVGCAPDTEGPDDAGPAKAVKARKKRMKQQANAEDTAVELEAAEVLELRVEPESPDTNDILRVRKQVRLPPGSRARPRLQWMKNGASIPGEISQNLNSHHFKKGDRLSVLLSFPPVNGKKSREVRSNEVVIGNSQPEIELPARSQRVDFSRPYTINASDPDDDDLVFKLKGDPKVPSGMRIQKTGRHEAQMVYSPSSSATAGDYTVTVVADDKELTAEWSFKITVGLNKVETTTSELTGETTTGPVEAAQPEEPIEGWSDEPIEGWEDEGFEGLEDED